MKQLFLFLLFAILILGSVSGETVLLYVSDDWISPDATRGAQYIVPSLEDGVMGAFFDAGHIIFNDHALYGMDSSGTNKMRPSLLLAKRGGAQVMVELEILYDEMGETPAALPREIIFSVTNVENNDSLMEGSLRSNDFMTPPAAEMEEVCQRLGSALAQRVLSLM